MQPRLQRYKQFIDTQFIDSLLWHKDYSIDGLDKDLRSKIEAGHLEKLYLPAWDVRRLSLM